MCFKMDLKKLASDKAYQIASEAGTLFSRAKQVRVYSEAVFVP